MYKDLIHKLPVATYSCDIEGRIVLYNKAAVALWGKEPELGKDVWYESWDVTNNKNSHSTLNLCSMATALKNGDPILRREIIIERPNGDKRNVLPYPVPFHNTEGQITGAVIVLADITEIKLAQKELRKSEKKYRYLFDNNPMPMWIITLETFKFLDVNKMAILQYGYSREEFLSMTALDIRPDDDKSHFIKSSDTSKINKSNYNRGIWNHLKKDGTIVQVEIIAHDIMYEGIPARLILSNDISDRKKAETNLEKRNKELIKTNSELDRFVYSVSHDLRSPLTSILGLLSFIETESQESDTLKHAELIRSSINRLDDFIKNILSYSRNNRTGLEVEKISLNEIFHGIVDSLQSMKEAKGIRYEIEVREQQPFYTDRLRFNTVLENLISNAIKYHKKEESNRYIKIFGYSDHESLHLTIADNGIGIAPEYHKKIYDMFFRLSGKDGSGIGLYIVKDTIEILQGSIKVQSEKGAGTTFTITLKNLKPC
ncbi:PAS domain-containing sensor histidine kinase [Flavobacterium sp. MDT1-60]|uniref:PAS domain-containing sensor histidine kinase n=1 Tax=Flavobacterium sp. MDT1-60 TaxID=1979344 RepID=UPI0017802EF1|nr:PAS domain-containing sensor histidine kinase [Flavobacterium sp. MDT1-60]QOG04715.1 PAS domain-containing sensor histidine kinase [Flavobacterium sp. MDT1-60]